VNYRSLKKNATEQLEAENKKKKEIDEKILTLKDQDKTDKEKELKAEETKNQRVR